jgi:hypothetical protein
MVSELVTKPEFAIEAGDACTVQASVAIKGQDVEIVTWFNEQMYVRWRGRADQVKLSPEWKLADTSAPAMALETAKAGLLHVDLMEMKLKPVDGGKVGLFSSK